MLRQWTRRLCVRLHLNISGGAPLRSGVKRLAPMKLAKSFKLVSTLILLIGLSGCSTPRAEVRPPEKDQDHPEADVPSRRFFVTSTPEMVESASHMPGSQGYLSGHWGAPWEGVRMSIQLPKEVFTNGEPIVACVMMRNTSYKVRATEVSWGHPEKDTRFIMMRGQERLLGEDDPKPGESFEQRLKYIRSGSASFEPLLPQTQYPFFRDLSKVFDLRIPGTYSVQAIRHVSAYNDALNHPGYIRGSATNLLSGIATFRIVAPGYSK
jgi:hypothetical protein